MDGSAMKRRRRAGSAVTFDAVAAFGGTHTLLECRNRVAGAGMWKGVLGT